MNKIILTLNITLFTFILIACSSTSKSTTASQDNIDSTAQDTINTTPQDNITTSPTAFNKYDETTFAASTCQNLPLTQPQGIFVSLNGKSTAMGSKEDPIDLATALSSHSPVRPGETIWIEEGVYTGTYVSSLNGSDGLPISVRPLPGQRVIIDSNNGVIGNTEDTNSALVTKGSWNVYCYTWGVPITLLS